ncbi:copia protein [Tanacetum coccineum]
MASNEETNAAGTDTRPPMLVESDYDSWKIRIHRSTTHLKAYDLMPKRLTRNKSSYNYCFDPWPMVAHTTSAPALSSPQNPIQRKALGNNVIRYSRQKVRCYNCRGEGHVARQCYRTQEERWTQYFKDKALLMEVDEGPLLLSLSWPTCHPLVQSNIQYIEENDLLKSTLSGKEKSIAFLQSEKEKILSEKKDLADSYLDEIVCVTQPVLYDADTLLHPNHHPVSIWDSEEVLVHQVVSMKKMNEKPGHVRPANGFYDKLNALMFVPQKDLSGDQAYWLSANEIASQASKSATASTPFWFTEGSCGQQQLETDRIQLKDTITSLRIQLDGLKVENVSLKRRYDELSKANNHSRIAYTEKLSAFTAENTKLKAQVTGTTSSGPSTSEKPKVLASGMYTNSSKSKGHTVADSIDSIAERLTRPTAYKFKTDCSITPV